MKINFDSQNVQMMKPQVSTNTAGSTVSREVSAAAEIGKTLSDNKTYEGRKKNVSDLTTIARATDVSTTQDYLTVMAHTVSSKDYAEMVEDGVNPMEVRVEDSVTILDHIKLNVVLGGGDVEGFTDTLDSSEMKALLGPAAGSISKLSSEYDVTLDEGIINEIKETYAMADELNEITDGMKLYLVNSELPISIDTLYLAKHSALNITKEQGSVYFGVETKGYLVKKGENSDINKLREEVANLLNKNGLSGDEETVENGLWLVNNSVAVTGENLERLADINRIELPLSDDKLARISLSAIVRGEKPSLAAIENTEDIYTEAVKLAYEIDKFEDISDVTRERIFAESRLKMLSEANLLLLKSDYSIDTKDLEAYVAALKEIEESPEYIQAEKLTEATNAIENVKSMPADIIGVFSRTIDTVSIEQLVNEGAVSRAKYENAGKAYEQLATEVRRDLGDSIKKAFSNVDDILEDLGFEKTDENRRSVRILGYNSMAINRESVEEVKAADKKVQAVLSRITPMDTLSLIRDGKSPIKMSIDELNKYLDENTNEQQKEIEKYSKFLFKLEKSGEITESERKEYIEVYRFFHQLEKGDLAAVGSVLSTGAELTVSNLKTAIKTSKHRGMDITIDDSFGFLVEGIRRELEPERLKEIPGLDGMTLENVYEKLQESDKDALLEREYIKEELTELKEAMKAPDEVVSELLMNKVPVSANTLAAMRGLMKQRGEAFSKLSEINGECFAESEESITESMTDEQTAKEAYGEAVNKAQDEIFEEAINSDSYIDVKSLQHTFLELSLARDLSKSETYEVPMEIDGEATSINLKIVHSKEADPNVVVSFETDRLGRVSARLNKENGSITGYISCNLQDTLTKMERVADILGKEVYTVMSGRSDTDSILSAIPMRENSSEVSSMELYETAKAFLEAVKGIN